MQTQAQIPLRRWLTFDKDFIALAHRHQEPPLASNNGNPWTCWLMLGGRGAGKTRLGAEWVRALSDRCATGLGRLRHRGSGIE
jgi:phage terminase large subunit-like protein